VMVLEVHLDHIEDHFGFFFWSTLHFGLKKKYPTFWVF
jgi:hypothetical protein